MKSRNKIILGTMKLKKYFFNSKDLSIFLNLVHKKKITQLHVSNEYKSYNLLIKSIRKIKNKKFNFILKLSEPSKDNIQFSLKKFIKKINKYRQDLGKNHTYSIQLVNRFKCNNRLEYLVHELKTLKILQNSIVKLKKRKIIKNFYIFPYHINRKINDYKFIDGITYYRNLKTKKIDNFAKKNNFKIIAMRTLGGNKKILKDNNFKKLIMFNLKSNLVKKVIVGANNKEQLNQLLNLC